jgi:hypothetical protein
MADAYNSVLGQLPPEQRDAFRREHYRWFQEYRQTCDARMPDADRRACVARFLSLHTQQLQQRLGGKPTSDSAAPAALPLQTSPKDGKANPNCEHVDMDALARKAHLPGDYFNRYHEDAVRALCDGDTARVIELIDKGFVPAAEIDRLRLALGIAQPLTVPPRSEAGRSYGFSRQKFSEMGLCAACADNVARWYVEQPNSRCGLLAKHALEGDPDAVKELLTFPSYCQAK